LLSVSATHRLVLDLHHAGDETLHTAASTAIAAVERNERAEVETAAFLDIVRNVIWMPRLAIEARHDGEASS